MDCEFIEKEFYCHHLRCKGEKQDDDLRWLTSPWFSNLDLTEQVGNATEPPHQAVQSTPLLVLSELQVSNLEGELEAVDTSVVDSLTEDVFAEEKCGSR